MLVDPEEDETALISPRTPPPVSGSRSGPDPTEERSLPLAEGDDEEQTESEGPDAEDETAIQDAAPGDDASKYRKR
ncbi:hypothetical protein BH10ACT11_BH10ACT11_18920 [soil metagenome]